MCPRRLTFKINAYPIHLTASCIWISTCICCLPPIYCERQWHSSLKTLCVRARVCVFSVSICKTFNIRIVCVIQNNWSFSDSQIFSFIVYHRSKAKKRKTHYECHNMICCWFKYRMDWLQINLSVFDIMSISNEELPVLPIRLFLCWST